MSNVSRMGAATRSISRQRVLVVDADEDTCESMRDVIQASLQGVDVLTAPSGEVAMGLLQREPVGLLIVDEWMPGMDGISLLRAARELYPGVPGILVTSTAAMSVAVRALKEVQVRAYLEKPVRPENLVVAVASVLHHNQAYLSRNAALAAALRRLQEDWRAIVPEVPHADPADADGSPG